MKVPKKDLYVLIFLIFLLIGSIVVFPFVFNLEKFLNIGYYKFEENHPIQDISPNSEVQIDLILEFGGYYGRENYIANIECKTNHPSNIDSPVISFLNVNITVNNNTLNNSIIEYFYPKTSISEKFPVLLRQNDTIFIEGILGVNKSFKQDPQKKIPFEFEFTLQVDSGLQVYQIGYFFTIWLPSINIMFIFILICPIIRQAEIIRQKIESEKDKEPKKKIWESDSFQ
jgi:hypothetical protein